MVAGKNEPPVLTVDLIVNIFCGQVLLLAAIRRYNVRVRLVSFNAQHPFDKIGQRQ
ncbi:hypothetical protein SDC9_209970 [bioreactor metagenome]|uniref:Uncharacterized protein n=1 Tax=bioreactor metagenome TaxID=1076179 RepID=A0A645JS34_9ZZZZ